MALVLALLSLSVTGLQAQRAALPASTIAERLWQAERTHQLNKVRERARYQLDRSTLKVEIGTMAPVDLTASRQALAQFDAAITADAARNPAPAPTLQEIAATRIKLAQALNAIDLTEVKFDNGMVSTKEMFDAYFGVINILIPK
jgi:hypothetical protein